MEPHIKLVRVEWRSRCNTIGFALFLDTITGKYQARFDKVTGYNTDDDLEHLQDYGMPMSFEEAKGFFSEIKKDEYK